jgi:septum formation protein
MEPFVELVLASASPRRRELISLLGIPFRVVTGHFEEPPPPDKPVSLSDLVAGLAELKAVAVADALGVRWVLAADTLVSLEEEVGIPLGKPVDEHDAFRMLRLLAGRAPTVSTGIALIPGWSARKRPPALISVNKTRVWFRELSDDMILDYIATGEPTDKAGAYGAQGYAAPFIERFDGDFHNVVGLPLCDVGRLLERAGLDWWRLRRAAGA